MDPQDQFCHYLDCPARGLIGQGNIPVQSCADRRYKCITCGRTCAATRGTPSYRKPTAHDVIPLVLTWLTHGCPLQALVAAFGLDERKVWTKASRCERSTSPTTNCMANLLGKL